MNARSVILILAALLIAAGTAFFARNWIMANRTQQITAPAPPPPPAQSILVAKLNLPAGTFIREDNVRWQAWPGESADPNYLLKDVFDPATLVGAVVRRGIVAGEPITLARVAKPGDRGFLAAVLKPGMRAVSVAIDATSGISGLIFPGDRVDLLLTHVIGESTRVSETVLENVRLLAIDQKLNDQEKQPEVGRTITIEVTPKQAEMIAVLVDLGRMSLSLRSLGLPDEEGGSAEAVVAAADPVVASDAAPELPSPPVDEDEEPVRGETFTLQNEVSHLLGQRAKGRKVMIVHGSEIEVITVGE
jgi:pilus assembly protein CpaB